MQCCNNTFSLYLVENIIDTNEIKRCLVLVANDETTYKFACSERLTAIGGKEKSLKCIMCWLPVSLN